MASLIIIQIMKKYPNGTVLDFLSHYFGKWIRRARHLLFAVICFIGQNCFYSRGSFIQAWILPQTDVYVLILLLSIPSYLIVRKNITILGRYSEFVFFLTLWTIIVFLMTLRHAEWLHLLPVLKTGWVPILTTVKSAIFSFIGFEIAFFLYPFLQKKEKASMGIVMANTLSLLAYLMITIGAFVFYSPDEITLYNEPTIVMLKVLEFRFIERLEIVFFSFYLFVMSTTILPFMYMAVFCTSQLVGSQDHRKPLVWFLLIDFVFVLLSPPSFDRNTMMQHLIEQVGMIIAYAFPLFLWGYVALHGLLLKRRAVK